MILRDRDANTAWESQADGTLEERVYYCQNWRADVVALMTDSGELINQVRYDPYGVPFGISKTDLDADGDVDAADYTQFSTYYSAGTMPYADWNWDGTKDTADITAYLNDKNADAGLGRGDPSYAYGTEGGANRKAYAGYEIDPMLTGSEGWESVYHVRFRVLLSQLGRWTRRDPLGYVDGMSVHTYVFGSPLARVDPHGLTHEDCYCDDNISDTCTGCGTCCNDWTRQTTSWNISDESGQFGKRCRCFLVQEVCWSRKCSNAQFSPYYCATFECVTTGNEHSWTIWNSLGIGCKSKCRAYYEEHKDNRDFWRDTCSYEGCREVVPPPEELWVPGFSGHGIDSVLICPPGWLSKAGRCIKLLFR